MRTFHAAAVMISLGSLAALPACSMMGMHPSGTTAALARPELSPDMVRQVQTSLQQQGMYKGNVDGVWGSGTQSAVQSYQQSHNLTANGQLDAPTLKSLNLAQSGSPATAAPAPAPAVSTAPP